MYSKLQGKQNTATFKQHRNDCIRPSNNILLKTPQHF